MATTKELEAKIERMEAMLAQLGLSQREAAGFDPNGHYDVIDFGSKEHAALLGILPLESAEQAAERQIYKSPTTGMLYCLEDEVAAVRLVPGTDPDKAILLVLRQKVNVFESGPPKVPENALPLWTPTPNPMAGL